MQARSTDAQAPGLGPQAQGQWTVQRQAAFFDIATIALHILQAERQGRLFHFAQHLAEKGFVLGLAHAQSGLGHVVAVGHRHRQGFCLAEQPGLHFIAHHLKGGMVQGHMMEQQYRDDPAIERIFCIGHPHQRRLTDLQAVVTRVETAVQLCADITYRRIEFERFKMQPRLTPNHLHGRFQGIPDHPGAQNVMAIDHTLQGLDEGIQALAISKGELCLEDVRVPLLSRQMVIENPLLQRCQRVDVLHVCCTARHAGDNPVDRRLVEADQRQQIWSDVLAAGRDSVGRNHDFTSATHRSGERCEGWLTEQHAHIGTQTDLTHASDQADRQQRVTAQLEEVIVTPHLRDTQQLLPESGNQRFGFTLRGFVA